MMKTECKPLLVENFILQAINDTQMTIRSIDIKIQIICAIVFLPVLASDNVVCHIQSAIASFSLPSECLSLSTVFSSALCFIAFISWICLASVLFLSFRPVLGSELHIQSPKKSDSFFCHYLYDIRYRDLIYQKSIIVSKKTHEEFYDSYPQTQKEALMELSFEHMKLVYIREIKVKRLQAIISLLLSTFVLIMIYMLTTY